jgi:single-stranded-DNA-specific exonuclease
MKKWVVINKITNNLSRGKAGKQQSECILDILLDNRGIKTTKGKEDFLSPKSPYDLNAKNVGIDLKQLNKAVTRIKKAIDKKEKIIIYGDYDSDGVCATAILWETLYSLTKSVLPYIPTRDEGYGMKSERLDEFLKNGVSLVITVDNGIVSYDQINHAKEIGLDLIITDHHSLGKEKVKAYAVIHTIELCGAGVSWFLANQFKKTDLDLVTIGTITDLMPLNGINRQIVYHGLEHLRKTKRVGLQELFKTAAIDQTKIGTYEIGYIIGPRLNAAGRMENPIDALRLICTSKNEQALDLAKKLDSQNRQRQSLMEVMTSQAKEMWLKEKGENKLIFVSSESWEYGIIGLVAGRLTEEFYRPSVVVSWQKQSCRASLRSVNGFNIIEAIRTSCADLLDSHGGHAMAAGFNVETQKLEEVKKRLTDFVNKNLSLEDLTPSLKVDLELSLEDLDQNLFKQINKLEPFGLSNPEPVFVCRGLIVNNIRTVGQTGKHLALILKSSDSELKIRAIGFNLGEYFSKISVDQSIDVAFNLIADQWNGNESLQLRIKDIQFK